ncbi:MAG: hypothetical protein DRQ60_10000, partial [Gammaproteobacteria bacterium]
GQRPVAALLRAPLLKELAPMEWPPIEDEETLDLLESANQLNTVKAVLTISRLGSLATLDEAHETMLSEHRQSFYAQADAAHGLDGIYGLLPISDVEHYYR